MNLAHLPINVIFSSVLFAFSMMLIKNLRVKNILIFLFSIAILYSCYLLYNLSINNVIYYNFGSWGSELGVQFVINKITTFFYIICCIPFAISLSFLSFDKKHSVIPFMLINFSGLIGMVFSYDLFNTYIFLEVSSIASYIIITNRNNLKSLKASIDYLIVGSVAGVLILIGIAIAYHVFGSLNYLIIGKRVVEISPSSYQQLLIYSSACLIIIGFLIKIGIYPLHNWMLKSYSVADRFILPFLVPVSSKISFLCLIKIIFVVFKLSILQVQLSYLIDLLQIISNVSIIVVSIIMLFEESLKKIIIFSSILQSTYYIIAASIVDYSLFQFVFISILFDGLVKSSILTIIDWVEMKKNRQLTIRDINVALTDCRINKMFFVFLILANAGLPVSIAFIFKIQFIYSLFQSNMFLTIALFVFSTIITIHYSIRIIESTIDSTEIDSSSEDGLIDKSSGLSHYFINSLIALISCITLLSIYFSEFIVEFTKNCSYEIF